MVGGGYPIAESGFRISLLPGEYFVFYGQMEPTMYVHWTYICVSVYVHMHNAHISAYDELKKRILHAVYADIYICRKPHMGQFVQGGKNGRLMSYFF